jgi:hypothetical protein
MLQLSWQQRWLKFEVIGGQVLPDLAVGWMAELTVIITAQSVLWYCRRRFLDP